MCPKPPSRNFWTWSASNATRKRSAWSSKNSRRKGCVRSLHQETFGRGRHRMRQ